MERRPAAARGRPGHCGGSPSAGVTFRRVADGAGGTFEQCSSMGRPAGLSDGPGCDAVASRFALNDRVYESPLPALQGWPRQLVGSAPGHGGGDEGGEIVVGTAPTSCWPADRTVCAIRRAVSGVRRGGVSCRVGNNDGCVGARRADGARADRRRPARHRQPLRRSRREPHATSKPSSLSTTAFGDPHISKDRARRIPSTRLSWFEARR